MYNNFSRLSNLSRSIAGIVIDIILFFVSLIIGLNYTDAVFAGFIIVGVGFVWLAVSNIFVMTKCIKFGSKTAFEDDIDNTDNHNLFKMLTNFIAIFTIIAIVCFIVGFILIIK